MDRTQRIILVLLVLAVLFSVFSIVISFSAFNLDAPSQVSGKAVQGGVGVSLSIEPTPGGENG